MKTLRLAAENSHRTRARWHLGGALLLFSSSWGVQVEVRACDCLDADPQRGFLEADVVFSGQVVAVTETEFHIHAFVDVLEIWKGELVESKLARVVTAADQGACGFPFRVGEEYVIFAGRRDGVLETAACTPTGMVSRARATELFGPPAFNPLNVEFRRGDVDGNGRINITDAVASLLYQFQGSFDPLCLEALDFENDGDVTITDTIGSLTYQFLGGPPPAPPFAECGKDQDLEPLDCERYPLCPAKTDTSEIVRIERVGDAVEVELFSTRPFPVRALPAMLCVGTERFTRSRFPEDGSLNTLIFTLRQDPFDAIQDASLVTVQHGDGCFLDLDQQRLYWDLWVFGPLEVSPGGGL